jgi:hypothetical protein
MGVIEERREQRRAEAAAKKAQAPAQQPEQATAQQLDGEALRQIIREAVHAEFQLVHDQLQAIRDASTFIIQAIQAQEPQAVSEAVRAELRPIKTLLNTVAGILQEAQAKAKAATSHDGEENQEAPEVEGEADEAIEGGDGLRKSPLLSPVVQLRTERATGILVLGGLGTPAPVTSREEGEL